jgi:hypothetical protein
MRHIRKDAPSAWALLAGVVTVVAVSAQAPLAFTVVESTIAGMRQAMEQGRVTSRELVRQSLTRLALKIG